MLDILKISGVIIFIALFLDIIRLTKRIIIKKNKIQKSKYLVILFLSVFIWSSISSIYSLLKYNTLEWHSILIVIVTFTFLRYSYK